MKLVKGFVSLIFAFFVIGLILINAGELLAKEMIMKPKVERIVTDLGDGIAIDDRVLSKKSLTSYGENLIDTGLVDSNEDIRIYYFQSAGDRRFRIKTVLNGTYVNGNIIPGSVSMEWEGIKNSAPIESKSFQYVSKERN